MKLARKVLIIMTITFLFLLAILFYISNLYIVKNIKQQENNELTSRIELVHNLLQEKINSLNRTTGDWAPWDDMYDFINNPTPEFINSNFDAITASNLQLNLLVAIKNNKILTLKAYDYITKQDIHDTAKIEKDFNEYLPSINIAGIKHDLTSGIIYINNQPMLISIRPITNSARNSGPVGILVMGRYLDSNVTDSIQTLSTGILTATMANDYKGLQGDSFNQNYLNISLLNNNNIMINYYVNDLFLKRSFNIELTLNRDIYNQGWQYLKFFIIYFIISLSILFIICNELLRRFIIKPLENINSEITQIDAKSMLNRRIKEKGNDEFTVLSKEINSMLLRIDNANKQVLESETQLKGVIEAASAGFWDWDIINDKLMVNDKTMELLGYGNNAKITSIEEWKKIIYEDDKMYSINRVNSSINNSSPILLEHRLLTKQNDYKWFLIQGKTIKKIEGKSVRVTGIITDINDKKTADEQLKYLTYYDSLTGLFNRGYYEIVLKSINTTGKLPLTIFIADVNGLKLINDTFSHAMGDKLLIEVSNLLREACGETTLISRLGGDEFSIIVEDSNETMVKDIYETIKRLCDKTQIQSLTVSIAIGYATKYSKDQDIHEIAKIAEERMYRNKLLEKRSARNSTISSLSKMLYEKSYETEEHAIRIFKICEKIGKRINLNSAQLDELNLLAKLHDIGKIAIPDNILNKADKLTEEEFEIIKTHTQIGYRIATELYDLRHVAYQILCHHENFDGSGYPNSLSGSAIPFLSRIVRIVDSFDVMISGRPYRMAMTKQDAIKELLKYSGKHYDPELIKLFIEVFEEFEEIDEPYRSKGSR